MAPKGKTGGGQSPKSIGGKAATGRSTKKKEVTPEALADLDFLQAVTSESLDKNIRKVLSLFQQGREKKNKEILVAASEAVVRICSDQVGFVRFIEAEGVEYIASVASDPYEAGGKYSIPAVHGLCAAAIHWLEVVDPVDFTELSRLLFLTLWLGGVDEDVAVAALAAIERFTLHRPEHAAGMVSAGVLNVLHRLLAAHTGPEFVGEVFRLLYLLCDMPGEAIAEHLQEELEIIGSVAECLEEAPVNIRLQVSGLRLLTMWATRLKDDEVVMEAIDDANIQPLLDSAVLNLTKAGFAHAGSWLTTIAGNAFERSGSKRQSGGSRSEASKRHSGQSDISSHRPSDRASGGDSPP